MSAIYPKKSSLLPFAWAQETEIRNAAAIPFLSALSIALRRNPQGYHPHPGYLATTLLRRPAEGWAVMVITLRTPEPPHHSPGIGFPM